MWLCLNCQNIHVSKFYTCFFLSTISCNEFKCMNTKLKEDLCNFNTKSNVLLDAVLTVEHQRTVITSHTGTYISTSCLHLLTGYIWYQQYLFYPCLAYCSEYVNQQENQLLQDFKISFPPYKTLFDFHGIFKNMRTVLHVLLCRSQPKRGTNINESC